MFIHISRLELFSCTRRCLSQKQQQDGALRVRLYVCLHLYWQIGKTQALNINI